VRKLVALSLLYFINSFVCLSLYYRLPKSSLTAAYRIKAFPGGLSATSFGRPSKMTLSSLLILQSSPALRTL